MKPYPLIASLGLLVACNSSGSDNMTGSNQPSSIPATSASSNNHETATGEIGCYMKVTGRDTAILWLNKNGDELSGQMVYDNFQKDGSRGTVKGKKEGDILKLFYDFYSEGTHSVMEVYFKEVTGGVLRGLGDMDIKGDTAYFRSGINYSEKEAFSKLDCSIIKGKFQ